ncbi:MAG: hypothetical protein IJ861_11150 [Clostridia bacterium]|nr:hypothetical protein [Clostridia bacterium]
MYCKSCGSFMEDTFNVCQNCGTKKGEGASFCDKCGAIRQVGTAFCQECGNQLNDQPVSSAQASTPYSQQTTAQQFQSQAQADSSQYLPPKKYCRNCGKQVMNNQVICTACGVKVGEGKAFCPHCAAPVSNPEAAACLSCGMSLKPSFDIPGFFKKFADNFTGIFAPGTDIKVTLLDYGAILLSALVFIFALLPSITVSVSFFGITESESASIFQISGFAGFLLVLALLVSIARFVPFVDDFIKNNAKIGKYYVLVAPALMVLGVGIVTIAVLRYGAAAAVASAGYSYADVSCYFNVLGWILIIFVLAAAGSAVLSFLRKEGKVNLGF